MLNIWVIVTRLLLIGMLFEFCNAESGGIVVFKDDAYYPLFYCMQINTTSESALVWITENGKSVKNSKETITDYLCEIKKSVNCIRNNELVSDSVFKNSERFAGIVLDRRWEDFKEITTTGEAEIKKLVQIPDSNFAFAFSVRIKQNGYLYICDSYYPWEAKNCYFIILGGWKNKKIGLRKCVYKELFKALDEFPSGGCKPLKAEFNKTVVISEKKWNHFAITKIDNKISLFLSDRVEPLLTFYDDKPFKPTYAMIRSNDVEGYWKLHDYNFLAIHAKNYEFEFEGYSNHACVKVYVNPCSQCNINLTLQNSWDRRIISYQTTTQRSGWQTITLYSKENIYNRKLKLIITSEEWGTEPYFIGDIINCASKEYRAISTNFYDVCCHSVKAGSEVCGGSLHTKINTVSNEDDRCPPDTFGKGCIPCQQFNNCKRNKKYCEVLPSANEPLCSCYKGYTGEDCYKTCTEGYYGKACKQRCNAGCDGCDNVSGKCTRCKENIYPEHNCTKLRYPVLINKPDIISVGHNSVNIEIDFNYKGDEDPVWYEIQTNDGKGWTAKGQHKFKDSISKGINDLLPSTHYYLRIVLISRYNKKEERSEFIQNQEFTTTCKDIAKDDINFVTNGATVVVSATTTSQSCALENYKLFTGTYNITLSNNATHFYEKCSNYTAIISKNETKLYEYNIRTGEDNENIQCVMEHTTDTSSTMIWDKYRDVTNYAILYEFAGSLYYDCPVIRIQNKTIHVQEPAVQIDNLIPYSKYNVYIENEEHTIFRRKSIVTHPTKSVTSDELADFSLTQSSNQLYITLTIECSRIQGPLNVSVKLQCISDWCADEENEFQEFSFNGDHKEASLSFRIKGLTLYEIEIHVNRDGLADFRSYRHTTNATASGPVSDLAIYSKTEESLNIRWKPAYPPMGHLRHYMITSQYAGWGGRWRDFSSTTEQIKPCKLWNGCHCATISNLYRNTNYAVKIAPVNEPNLIGVWSEVIGLTEQEKPNPPDLLELVWSENYDQLRVVLSHPNITNGPLTYFTVQQDGNWLNSVPIQDENVTYTYMISDFQPATKLTIAVNVRNKAGASKSIANTTYTPPPIPELNTKDINIDANITNVMLELPEMKLFGNDVDCSIAIVVTKISSPSQLTLDSFSIEDRRIIEESKVPHNYTSWVAWKKYILKSEKMKLYIGDDNSSTNRVLLPDTEYKITVFVKNSYQGITKSLIWTEVTKTLDSEADGLNLLLLLVLLIVPVLCIFIFILRSRGITIKMPKINYGRTRDASNESASLVLQPVQPVKLRPKPAIYQNAEEALEDQEFSRPVTIAELENYIKESLTSGEFERQHALFPRGQTKPWTFGTKPENKSKNRYVNLAAYDHSRVRLNIINRDPNSEYINANYIDGYNCQKAFIATQGPKVNTLNDFWRMIWQEQVEYIVMIANLVEGGKKKVAKYWPDINETLSFGEVSVKYMSITVFASFEERTFTASSQGEHRTVKQLHFTSWPDHGVPMYAQSLAPFLKKVLLVPQDTAPIVIHCSAGVGRTGTLILADICLRMAAKTGYVDVLYYQHKIREQRPNMVDNVEQYKLVHLLLLHCLVAPETSIICTENMNIIVEELLASKEVANQLKYLEESTWQDEAMHTTASKVTLPIVYEKNRFRNIVPGEYSRIILTAYPPSDETSMYINAIKVDGFQASGKFVATQYPLKNTVGDFWRLIIEQELTIAICLNELCLDDEIPETFFPCKPDMAITPVPYLTINFVSMEEETIFNKYTLNVINSKKKGEVLNFTLIHFKNWNYDQLCPEGPIPLLTLFEEMNRFGKHTERILISCYDGVRACGLYTALCFLIEKIKLEQICDVCLAVRTVRHSRKEFVREVEQFRFLYLCALEYVKMFEMYSNFRL